MILWAKYGTQTTFMFPMVKRSSVDLAVSADWTPAAADSAISKDLGNWADTTNTVAAATGGTPTRSIAAWKLTLSATEMQAARIDVQIVDAATKAVEDQYLKIYTYGNASAMFAGDWSDIVRLGLTALPNAAAEAAGGLYTRGTGAGQIAQDANGNIRANLDTIKTQTVTCAAGVTVLASVGTAATSTAQTGDNYARLGAPAGASIAADIAAVKADTAATLADTGTDGVVISSATQNAIADALLDRDMATGTDSGSATVRTPRQALRILRNKVTTAGGTLTVTKEDDTTTSWTGALTTDAAADPITAVDPASS